MPILYWSVNTGVRHLNGIFSTDPDVGNEHSRVVSVIAHPVKGRPETPFISSAGEMVYVQAQEKLYWIDPHTTNVMRADKDGKNPEVYLVLRRYPNNKPDRESYGLTMAGNWLYYTDGPANLIEKAPIKPNPIKYSEVRTLYKATDGLARPMGIAVDKQGQQLYWTNIGYTGTGDAIQVGSTNGGAVKTLVKQDNYYADSIAVDHRDGTIYWNERTQYRIRMLRKGSPTPQVFAGKLKGYPMCITIGIDPNNAAHRRLYWGYIYPRVSKHGNGIEWKGLDGQKGPDGKTVVPVLRTLHPYSLLALG